MLRHRLTITCLQSPLSHQLPGFVHAQQGSQHDHPWRRDLFEKTTFAGILLSSKPGVIM
jgi:hypothetical protein